MFRRWTARSSLTPDDVFRRPSLWEVVSPAEASSVRRWVPVVVVSQGPQGEQATWYDDHAAATRSASPSARQGVRYYRFAGKTPFIIGAARPGDRAEATPANEEEEVAEAAPIERRRAEGKTWIGIELINSAGKPVGGKKYRIQVPDGTPREGILDTQGRARVDGIDPGTCRVSFPDIDAREWQGA